MQRPSARTPVLGTSSIAQLWDAAGGAQATGGADHLSPVRQSEVLDGVPEGRGVEGRGVGTQHGHEMQSQSWSEARSGSPAASAPQRSAAASSLAPCSAHMLSQAGAIGAPSATSTPRHADAMPRTSERRMATKAFTCMMMRLPRYLVNTRTSGRLACWVRP